MFIMIASNFVREQSKKLTEYDLLFYAVHAQICLDNCFILNIFVTGVRLREFVIYHKMSTDI